MKSKKQFLHLILGLIILVLACAFSFAFRHQQRKIKSLQQIIQNQKEYAPNIETPIDEGSFKIFNKYCKLYECLFEGRSGYFDGNIGGLMTLKGYYTPVERTAWSQTKTCNSFTIISGPEEFIDLMNKEVDMGNSIHSKNEENQPVINLGLDLLNAEERQKITASSTEKQIELIVLSTLEEGREALVCHPDVIVLRQK